MQVTSERIEDRVQRLEELEAIRRVTMELARHFDHGYDADAIVELFAPDATIDGAEFGQYNGRHEIHAFYSGISDQITFAKHHLTTHTIDLDRSGVQAEAVWCMLATLTMGGTAMFLALNWDTSYRKIDERWLITHFKLDIQFLTPYQDGWAKVPMAV